MQDTAISNVRIKVVNKHTMEASVSGTLRTYVLNLAGYEGIPASTDFDIPGTVVPELSKESLSVDDFYRYSRYIVLLRQLHYEDGISELYRAPKHGLPEAHIPLVYDYFGKGGWKLYYIPAKYMDDEQMAMLAAHNVMEEAIMSRHIDTYKSFVYTIMGANQATKMDEPMSAHEAVPQ